jgi:hypothetical protein
MAGRADGKNGADGKPVDGKPFVAADSSSSADPGPGGDGHINGIPIEPTEPDRNKGGRNKDGSYRKGSNFKGRKGKRHTVNSGGTEAKKERSGLPNLEITAGALKGAHDFASMLVRITLDPNFDELELDDAEAEKLASALLALAKYYPGIDIPGLYLAWLNLATTMGTVYSPKVATFNIRRKNERKAKPAPAPVPMQARQG